MMNHTIPITFDLDSLTGYTDSFLATLWHVAQANPAPFDDKEPGEIAELIGREIIRRFLQNAPPELWAHQGQHHTWRALSALCKYDGTKWVQRTADEMEARP